MGFLINPLIFLALQHLSRGTYAFLLVYSLRPVYTGPSIEIVLCSFYLLSIDLCTVPF